MGLFDDIEQRTQERRERLKREGPDRDTFLQWRSPCFGISNPDNLTNPFWSYAIREGGSGWGFKEDFDGPDSFEAGPCFSFQRYGQAEVHLADGRRVLIGGTHEDFYDPDFCIYNDVVVRDGDNITVYGYPEAVFPPTDYATATLVGDEIWIIGSLGYKDKRDDRPTQIRVLNTQTWTMRTAECQGPNPGAIWGHQAELSADGGQLLVSGGQRHCRLVDMDPQSLINPSIHLHLLNMASQTWTEINRDKQCHYWLITPETPCILPSLSRFDRVAVPAGHKLEGLACHGHGDLNFRLPWGRSEDQSLVLTVEHQGRSATVTLQMPPSDTNNVEDDGIASILDALIDVLEAHYDCGSLQITPIQREQRVQP